MTCKHSPGDPACSSSGTYQRAQRQKEAVKFKRELEELRSARQKELDERTPNPDEYEVVDALEINGHLILKVRYPSCKRCSFDATKVLVLANVDMLEALKWKRIDPHFSSKVRPSGEAPSPMARFPASPEGWEHAREFALIICKDLKLARMQAVEARATKLIKPAQSPESGEG